MSVSDDRQALLSSLQEAIDAVPEAPAARAGGASPSVGAGAAGDEHAGAGGAAAGGSEEADTADQDAVRDASKRAYAILALRDHSRSELKSKLVDRGHEERVVDELLRKLEDAGLIDDAHFAEQFVRSQRTGKGKSRSAISRSLKEKGVSDDVAREALEDVGDDFPFALEAARKKAASTRGLAYDVRLRRTLGVLARRGFAGSVARRAAEQALEE